jgi:lysophospholipase L1-like esterase
VHVVMMNLGTNGEDGGVSFGANYLNLAQQIFALEPQVRFVVQTIFSTGSVVARNATLQSAWSQMANSGMPVYLTTAPSDPVTGILAGDLADGIHPNPAGYVKLGHLVSPALVRCLKGL